MFQSLTATKERRCELLVVGTCTAWCKLCFALRNGRCKTAADVRGVRVYGELDRPMEADCASLRQSMRQSMHEGALNARPALSSRRAQYVESYRLDTTHSGAVDAVRLQWVSVHASHCCMWRVTPHSTHPLSIQHAIPLIPWPAQSHSDSIGLLDSTTISDQLPTHLHSLEHMRPLRSSSPLSFNRPTL